MEIQLVFLLTVAIVVVSSDIGSNPTIPYINLWTDGAGETHLSQCELDEFNLTSFSTAAKQYVSNNDMDTKRYVFNIFPTNWFGDWHPAPSLQWVVTLSGSWFTRASDGSMVDLPAGAIIFNNDSNATLGHQSGVSENYQTASVLVVQVTALPKHISCNKCSAGGAWVRDIVPSRKVNWFFVNLMLNKSRNWSGFREITWNCFEIKLHLSWINLKFVIRLDLTCNLFRLHEILHTVKFFFLA